MIPAYRGLTWDHPRGFHALREAAAEVAPSHGVSIGWDRQPLEGFESHPIADLCARYDLVVLDHPHVGEAYEADCLTALEDVFLPPFLAGLQSATIGPCLSSYRYGGRHWALPLDAATQVMAYRPDLTEPVATWDDVDRLAEAGGVALSLAGPHAILSLLSIASALGEPPAEREPTLLVSERVGSEAVELLARLSARAVPSTLNLNPIGILAYMSSHDDVRLCPLIYGYVNYTRGANGARELRFADAPRAATGGRPGSTLGGTGIGISRNCSVTPELVAYLEWLMGAEAQERYIPAHDGQPSRRSAWQEAELNAAWGGFYEATSATLEAAYVRPRHSGYIAWQAAASAYLREALAARTRPAEVVRHLNDTHRKSIGDRER